MLFNIYLLSTFYQTCIAYWMIIVYRITKKSSKKSVVGSDDLDEEENIQVNNKEESTDVRITINSEFTYNSLIEYFYLSFNVAVLGLQIF